MNLSQKADTLRRLHRGPETLLLANAWDVASARMLEEMGFPAVGTSSAAIANSLGYPDGERITRGEMLTVVARIAAAVAVPVTADMEAGYGDDMEATTQELIEAGAVGLNLEDSIADGTALAPLEVHAAKVKAVREAGVRAGVEVVINARTDAFFLSGEGLEDPFAEAVRRARAYRVAGADCIFVPGIKDIAAIAGLIEAAPGAFNILGGPGAPGVEKLRAVGVRRISLGSGPYRAALGLARRIAGEMRAGGGYELIEAMGIPYAEINGWLDRRRMAE